MQNSLAIFLVFGAFAVVNAFVIPQAESSQPPVSSTEDDILGLLEVAEKDFEKGLEVLKEAQRNLVEDGASDSDETSAKLREFRGSNQDSILDSTESSLTTDESSTTEDITSTTDDSSSTTDDSSSTTEDSWFTTEDSSSTTEEITPATDDGSSTTEDSSSTIEDITSTAADDGSSTTEDSSSTTDDSSSTTGDGSSTTEDSWFTTEDSSPTAEDSSSTIEDITSTADDSSSTTEEITPATDDSSSTTGDGSSTTEDGWSTTEDSSSTTGDGSSTTEEITPATDHSSSTTEDSSSTTVDGSSTTDDSSPTTEDSWFTSEDSSSTTDDGSSTIEDSSSTTEGDNSLAASTGVGSSTKSTSRPFKRIARQIARRARKNYELERNATDNFLRHLYVTEDEDILTGAFQRLMWKYGDTFDSFPNNTKYSGKDEMSCAVQCEYKALAAAHKQNQTKGFIKCAYFKEMRLCMLDCGWSDRYNPFVFSTAHAIVREFCPSEEQPSTFDETRTSECFDTLLKDKSFTSKVGSTLTACLIRFQSAKSEEGRCDVLSNCVLGETLEEFDKFCGLPHYAKLFRALVALELGQFSEGRLVEKCPQLYEPFF